MPKGIDITDRDSIELLARMPIQALEGFFNDQEAEAEELTPAYRRRVVEKLEQGRKAFKSGDYEAAKKCATDLFDIRARIKAKKVKKGGFDPLSKLTEKTYLGLIEQEHARNLCPLEVLRALERYDNESILDPPNVDIDKAVCWMGKKTSYHSFCKRLKRVQAKHELE